MAKQNTSHSLISLRTSEFSAGLVLFAFYLVITPLLLTAILKAGGWELDSFRYNIICYCVNFLGTVAVFHRFLFDSLRAIGRSFWLFVQAVVLATVLYFAVTHPLSRLLDLLPVSSVNLNNESVMQQLHANFSLMTVCVGIFVPVIEECLCRGLIFGTIHRKSRIAAYLVSMLIFALLHTGQYAFSYSLPQFLLITLRYCPAGIALCWAYEKSGTIWGAILAHALINFITAFVTISI